MPILRTPSRPEMPAVSSPEQSGEHRNPTASERRPIVRESEITGVRPRLPPRPALRKVAEAAAASTRTTTLRMHPAPSGGEGSASASASASAKASTRQITQRMQPVRGDAPPPSGRLLDEHDFHEADGGVPLELQTLPKGQAILETRLAPPVVHFHPGDAAAPPSRPSLEMQAAAALAERQTAPVMPVNTQAGVVAFAGFGTPPTTWTEAPTYALRVLLRKHALRQSMTVVRRQEDLWLYEAALQVADERTVQKGLAILAGCIVLFAVVVGAGLVLLG